MSKVAIPQADEQQRLLANLITQMNLDRTPLPRFWYLPRGGKAAVVLTGDDHGNGGTASQFDTYEAVSPNGCSVADWQCVRSTSYVFPSTQLTDAQAQGYQRAGFEIALHPRVSGPNTGAEACHDFTSTAGPTATSGPAPGLRREVAEPRGVGHQPHPLRRVERLGHRAEGRARDRDPIRHELSTTGQAPGCRTAPACSRAPGSRCASPTPTAR